MLPKCPCLIYMSSGGVSPEDINSTQVSLEGSDSRAHITSVGKSASHSQSSSFSLLYYNARSLFPKMDCLHALVSIHKPDAICIVETWLCPDITAVEISLPGYSAVRLDRDRHGGGIILFVADLYNVKQGPLDLEFLLVSVQCAPFKLSVAVLYRSPSSHISYFDNLYSILESFNPSLFRNLVLVGDFNVDFCKSSHTLYQKLLTILSSFSLTQVVSSPTHHLMYWQIYSD